jgi:integrase
VGKRGNGEGSISRRKNGTWRAECVLYTADGRRRKTVYGKTRAEVAKKLNRAYADSEDGYFFDDEGLKVGDYLERWLESSVKGNVSPRTYTNYRLQVRRHLTPALGRIKLKDLTPFKVQGLYRSKLDAGLSNASVRYTHAVLHRALKQAVKWSLVPRNVAEAVDPPRVRREEITPLSAEQSRAFLAAARGDRFEALYVVALTCGLRQGEILGLKWSDANLGTNTLRVNRQIQRHRDGDGLIFSEPKNASRRTVPLTATAVEALKRHGKRQAEEKMRVGSLYEDGGLLFASEIGTPLDAQNIVNRSFKPLLKRAGLPSIRFHDLRHTCATLLLAKGVHPKLVQALLGHASIGITMDLYSHWAPAMGDQTAAAMEDLLQEDRTEPEGDINAA